MLSGRRGRRRTTATWLVPRSRLRESAGRLRFVEAREADAIIHLIWIAPGSGVYGEMRRVVIDDLPRAFVYVTPSIDGQGPAIARLAARDPLLRDTMMAIDTRRRRR